jgi:hypothetical protein
VSLSNPAALFIGLCVGVLGNRRMTSPPATRRRRVDGENSTPVEHHDDVVVPLSPILHNDDDSHQIDDEYHHFGTDDTNDVSDAEVAPIDDGNDNSNDQSAEATTTKGERTDTMSLCYIVADDYPIRWRTFKDPIEEAEHRKNSIERWNALPNDAKDIVRCHYYDAASVVVCCLPSEMAGKDMIDRKNGDDVKSFSSSTSVLPSSTPLMTRRWQYRTRRVRSPALLTRFYIAPIAALPVIATIDINPSTPSGRVMTDPNDRVISVMWRGDGPLMRPQNKPPFLPHRPFPGQALNKNFGSSYQSRVMTSNGQRLPFGVMNMIFEMIDDIERILVERTCSAWYSASVKGAGWSILGE